MLPNFIIGGGVASGTSFLSATLMNHPDIYLPKVQRPEPNFYHYSWKFSNGIDWYQNLCFSEVTNQTAVGERSSLLLSSPVAAARMKQVVPNAKLIFCLRNPIERAWGNYRFTVLEGLELLSFDEAIGQESERMKNAEGIWSEVQPHAYVTRSRYAARLREFIGLFGSENILILKSEILGAKPRESIARVCEFLGVDSSLNLAFPPNFSSPTVNDRAVQVDLRNYFGNAFSELVESIRTEEDVYKLLKNEEDRVQFDRLKNNLGKGKEPLVESSRVKLQELLKDDIKEVGELVDFSVSDWI